MIHRIGGAIAVVLVIAFVGTGVHAAAARHDDLHTALSFVLAAVSTVAAVLQLHKPSYRTIRETGRTVVAVFAAVLLVMSIPAIWVLTTPPTIKIGVSLPLTGGNLPDALPILRSVRLVVDKVNDETPIGNHRIEAVPFDDSRVEDSIRFADDDGKLERGTHELDDVIDDAQVAGIVGPFTSGAALTEIPAVNEAGMALISHSTTLHCLTSARCNEAPANSRRTFFRLVVSDDVRTRELVRRLSPQLDPGRRAPGRAGATAEPRVIVFTDATPFGDGFAEEFISAWTTAGGEPPKRAVARMHAGVLGARREPPALVVFAGTGTDGLTVYRYLQRQPKRFAGTMFAGSGTITNGAFTRSMQRLEPVGRLYAIAPVPSDETPDVTDFASTYISRYQQDLTPYCVTAADATTALLMAVRAAAERVRPPSSSWDPLSKHQAKAFRAAVVHNLRLLNRSADMTFPMLTGATRFDTKGDVVHEGPESDRVSLYSWNDRDKAWRLSRE
ncbi:hypothetical protein GCM10020369_01850 [Cryptosporangium minutisporangium]|uniref:Leucine-binding protein domain-containing protein n=1 Tax=Cryptosporangium minutisporangium TaxID=113569 RepID=A0ABP6SQU2_9ACTN